MKRTILPDWLVLTFTMLAIISIVVLAIIVLDYP